MGKAPRRNPRPSILDRAWMEFRGKAMRDERAKAKVAEGRIVAPLYLSVYCPSCSDSVMFRKGETISCQSEGCDLFNRQFKPPAIELVPADEPTEHEQVKARIISNLYRSLGSTTWLDGLTDEEWNKIRFDILPVVLRKLQRRLQKT